MLDTIKIGQIALKNGCIKFRRRSSKDFLELTVVAPLVGVHRHNTEIAGHLVVQLVGGRNEYSLDHHNWVCGRGDREVLSSWQQVRAYGVYFDYRAGDCWSFGSNIPWPGGRVVSSRRECRFHRRNRWRDHSPGSVGTDCTSS